jgi:hypothetical protein
MIKLTANGWMHELGEPLPEDWEIEILIRHGEASIQLLGPDGKYVFLDDDNLDAEEMLRMRVDHARVSDGLLPHFKPQTVSQ